MEINLKSEFVFILPTELENSISVAEHLQYWSKLNKESEKKRLKENRLKKLDKINNIKNKD
jgi:hypothetical protein